MNANRQPQIGDVYLMRFCGSGSEQNGWRPGIVFQNNIGNAYSQNIIALPLTSQIKKANQPTHVVLPAKETGLRKDSMVLCENPERMSKDRLGDYLTTIPAKYMAEIAAANILASAAIAYIDPDVLLSLWQKAISLNATSVA
jgi:mRNA interferase MazF